MNQFDNTNYETNNNKSAITTNRAKCGGRKRKRGRVYVGCGRRTETHAATVTLSDSRICPASQHPCLHNIENLSCCLVCLSSWQSLQLRYPAITLSSSVLDTLLAYLLSTH